MSYFYCESVGKQIHDRFMASGAGKHDIFSLNFEVLEWPIKIKEVWKILYV